MVSVWGQLAETERRRLLREARRWRLLYARTRRLDDLRESEKYFFLFYDLVVKQVQEELTRIWEEIREKRKGEVTRERLIALRDRTYYCGRRFRRTRRGVRRVWGRGSYYIWLRHPEWIRLGIPRRAYYLLRWKFPELEVLYRQILVKIREILPPPPPPPPPKPIVAVVDSTTGFLITYYEKEVTYEKETGRVWLYDEERKELVRKVRNVRVEYTSAVETDGHEYLIAEVTCWTIIKAEELNHKHAIKDITDRLIDKAKRWLLNYFTLYTKEGIPVVPNFRIIDDFDIQRREKPEEARFEGAIKQWYLTVTMAWEQKPKIIKAGVGYYDTDETEPHWTRAHIFVEYSHAEEPHPAHRHPPTWEIIDP